MKRKLQKGVLLSRAIQIAVAAHFGVLDFHKKPYILHPLAVMHKLRTDDEELQCIAVLHDVIEDNKSFTYEMLREAGMTQRIIDGVGALTKIPGESEREYFLKVANNKDAIIVKMSDLRHNTDIRRLKGVSDKDVKRIVKYNKMYYALEKKLQNAA